MAKWRYGVILDAGSSGTRLHVYRWLNNARARLQAGTAELSKLPTIKTKKKWTMKVKPGISTFGPNPTKVGPEHLEELFAHAIDVVPKDQVADTPIFLLATAGMRLLPPTQRDALLAEICTYAQTHTGFQIPDCNLHIQVIPGTTEGLYGWLAANYLLGGFDDAATHAHGKDHHTYGFLDMGGASSQIAFAPNKTESIKHANDLQLVRLRTINGASQEYRVFTTTWLEYGVNEARKRYLKDLVAHIDSSQSGEIPDPCLPVGMVSDPQVGVDLPAHLVGTGDFPQCVSRTLPLIDKEAACADPPCLFHGIHVPAIDFEVNHFVGVSEYWHTTHEIFEMGHTDKAYDFRTYQERVSSFCSQDWQTIEKGLKNHKWGNTVDEERAAEVCFKASWLINMLHEGIGIPRVGLEQEAHNVGGKNATKKLLDSAKQEGFLAPFQAVNKIDSTEVSWTLGKMVLYAASQVPPQNPDELAVGFGSNVPGIPDDFQFAGGRIDTSTDTSDDLSLPPGDDADNDDPEPDDDSAKSFPSKFFPAEAAKHRTPGVLLILLIILVAIVLLIGRERRANLFRKLLGKPPKNGNPRSPPSSFRSKLPFGLGGTKGARYERVMEEGAMPAPGDFELGALSSGSSDSSIDDGEGSSGRSSHGSGRSRRKRRPDALAAGTSSPYKGSASPLRTSTSGVGLSGTAGEGYFPGVGLGLNMRTDGGDRLRLAEGAAASGQRSHNSSPRRWRSPMMTPYKENVD